MTSTSTDLISAPRKGVLFYQDATHGVVGVPCTLDSIEKDLYKITNQRGEEVFIPRERVVRFLADGEKNGGGSQ
ncbi:MAG: hypothetical protein V1909_02610 [Candidatus Micrarchaeota archaeon]